MSCKTPEIKVEEVEVMDSEDERIISHMEEEDDYLINYQDYGSAVMKVEAELNGYSKTLASKFKTIDIADWYLKRDDIDVNKKFEKTADRLYSIVWLNTLAGMCLESGISINRVYKEADKLWKRQLACCTPAEKFIRNHSKEIGNSIRILDSKSEERLKEWKKTHLSKPKKA